MKMKKFVISLAVIGLITSEHCCGRCIDCFSSEVRESNSNNVAAVDISDSYKDKSEREHSIFKKYFTPKFGKYFRISESCFRIAIGTAVFAKTALVYSEFSKMQLGILSVGIGVGYSVYPPFKRAIEVGVPIIFNGYKFCGKQIYKGIQDVQTLYKEGFSDKMSKIFGDKFEKFVKLSESCLRIAIGTTVFAKTALFCSGFSKIQFKMLCIGIGSSYFCCPVIRDLIETGMSLMIKGYSFFGNQIYGGIRDIWKMCRHGQY